MKTLIVNQKYLVLILTIVLMAFGTQSSYGQTITASTPEPLTEATLHGSVVTLALSGGTYQQSSWDIERALTVAGIQESTVEFDVGIVGNPGGIDIEGIPIEGFDIEDLVNLAEFQAESVPALTFDVQRLSDTAVAVTLSFSGDFDTDTTLTFTLGAGAISGYAGTALTAEVPVIAVEESLIASTEFPLTEATLPAELLPSPTPIHSGGISVVTLTLNGRRFTEYNWEIGEALKVSGIDGVAFEVWNVNRVSDTEVTVPLTFNGDFDTDATLTLTIGASAIAGYNKAFTVEVPVTAVEQSDATVSVSPSPVLSPAIGEELTLSLNIADGEDVAGYQAIVLFDGSALDYVESANGAYLPAGAFFGDPIVIRDWLGDTFFGDFMWSGKVILAATTSAGVANGDGTLATLTFEVIDATASTVTLSQVYLIDSNGKRWEATLENGEVTEPPEPAKKIVGDINRDGVVNIQDLVTVSARFGQTGQNSADLNGDGLVDIVDLALVAAAIGDAAASPSLHPQTLATLTASDVRLWLSQAQSLTLTDAISQRGTLYLQQLLIALTPKETALLANYPNPFNPETWIPYQLSKEADVTLRIYAVNGTLVRTLTLGYQPAGMYQNRSRAAYWDGRNAFGEPVASGVYFYTLTAGDFTATRKMLIQK